MAHSRQNVAHFVPETNSLRKLLTACGSVGHGATPMADAESQSPVVVTFAVKEEMKFFAGRAGIRRFITGMGRDNAERNVIPALDEIKPRVVLTCGYAGGLNPKFKS